MTRESAGELIKILVLAYPTQKRDKEFLALLALAIMRSGHSPAQLAGRIEEWIRTEVFWPSIAQVVAPFEEHPPEVRRLPPPKNAIPAEQGIALLKQTTIERPQ